MRLVIGLGNPGKKYEHTRHNMGFDVLDAFCDIAQVDVDKDLFKGLIGRGRIFDEDTMFLKPQTFMNLSGDSVVQVVNYFKIEIEDIIVIYDDMALEPGVVRLRANGTSGGHKGMQDIINKLHTSEIKRIRVGIGEPKFDVVDYVLGKPHDEEKEAIDKAIEIARDALKEALKSNFNKAMSLYNGKALKHSNETI